MTSEKDLFDKVEQMSGKCPIFDEVEDFDVPDNIKNIKVNLIDLILNEFEESLKSNRKTLEYLFWDKIDFRSDLFKIIRPVFEDRNGKKSWYLSVFIDPYMNRDELTFIKDTVENKFNVLPVVFIKKVVKQDKDRKREFFVKKFL